MIYPYINTTKKITLNNDNIHDICKLLNERKGSL